MARTPKVKKEEDIGTGTLRVLYVEDNPMDVTLTLAQLKKAGFKVSADVVQTREEFAEKLRAEAYDLILADYQLPGWTGMEALELVQEKARNVPFILLTGALGEETAVECIKKGATDFVLKDRSARLPEAIRRALEEKAVREDRNRAAEALRETNQTLTTLVQASPLAIVVIDPTGNVTMWNPAAERIFGWRDQETLGRFLPIVPEVKLEEFHALRERALRGESLTGVVVLRQRRDGSTIPVSLSTAPLRDAEGKVRGIVSVLADITERVQAEKALQDSEERYRLLFEANPQPMWVFDLETLRFLAVNSAAVEHYGYSRKEFLAMTAQDICPPEDVPAFLRQVSKLTPGLDKPGTWKHRKKDGTVIDVELASHSVVFAGRRAELVLANDVTERKRLEEQLQQAQKMEAVGRLAGGIAHDFNNLLTIITGYGQLLLDRIAPSEPLREQVEEIKKAGDRATALTRRLLAFSRRQVLAPRVLDLNSIVHNTDKLLRPLIREDIQLLTIPGRAVGQLKADPVQIEQVILNLALNACDAMPQGGKLTIETANVHLDKVYVRHHIAARPGPYVMLAVSDTGNGMDRETQAHIFEPFFTTKEKGKGTGLGLAMVYGIVKQSGGYIWVYSEPGRGTAFKIYFPRVDVAAEVVEPPKDQAGPPSGSETILLVEDEETVRSLVRRILTSKGYTVLEASRPDEAQLVCQQHEGPIHLMLTDVVMPGISAPELAERVATLRPETRVLYMSGYADVAVVHHGVLEASTAFIAKPFTPDALARKVREILDGPPVRKA